MVASRDLRLDGALQSAILIERAFGRQKFRSGWPRPGRGKTTSPREGDESAKGGRRAGGRRAGWRVEIDLRQREDQLPRSAEHFAGEKKFPALLVVGQEGSREGISVPDTGDWEADGGTRFDGRPDEAIVAAVEGRHNRRDVKTANAALEIRGPNLNQ